MMKFLPAVLVASLLLVRAGSPDRWSEWTFGDAQTMLATQHYRADGFLATRFLWSPQAHTPFARLFDEPELNHHAVGTYGGHRNFRMYTHYPSWYALPYGWLAKIGVTDRRVYHLWALFLSFAAVFLFHRVARAYFGEPAAGLAALLLIASPLFISYADSLATMPYDFFFRFLFMWLWLTGRPLALLTVVYFVSALCSIDSYFFIPLWVLAHETLVRRQPIPFRALAILALAPLAAMAVQFAQNASYMGWRATIQDWTRIAAYLNNPKPNLPGATWMSGLYGYLRAIVDPLEKGFFTNGVSLALLVVGGMGLLWQRRRDQFWTLLALWLPGLGFCLAFPKKSGVDYQSIQVIAFVVCFYATVTVLIWREFQQGPWRRPAILAMAALAAFNLAMTYGKGWARRLDFPARVRIDRESADFFDRLRARHPGARVAFQIGSVFPALGGAFAGQVDPIYEYYFGGLLTGRSPDLDRMIRDIQYLRGLGHLDHEIVVFAPDGALIEAAVSRLVRDTDLRAVDRGQAPPRTHYLVAKPDRDENPRAKP